MTTEIAMLLSAGIAATISLLALVITRLFDARSEKRKERENFFGMIFPKRLELYEELIKITDFIASPITITDSESTEILLEKLTEKHNALADKVYRYNTFGSINVTAVVVLMCRLLDEFGKHIYASDTPGGVKKAYAELALPEALEIRHKLLTFIREESGADLVDEKIAEFMKRTAKP